MKCPKCSNKPNLEKRTDNNHNYWWVCPQCKLVVGKKKEQPKEEK